MPDAHSETSEQITGLLRSWRAGSADALDRLIPLVYGELRAIARRHLGRERPGHTLTTAALVHEAYLDLLGQASVDWKDRVHFFAIASRTMRRVLVWHARKRNAAKRGGGRVEALDEGVAIVPDRDAAADELLALDDALERLEAVDPRLCRVVECRHFGGLSVEETAEALSISPATVKRDWQSARAWLRLALSEDGDR
ncbi:MAG: sigma-70 family RNA polymerase sigma factor [Gemmatimonadales bacterium]